MRGSCRPQRAVCPTHSPSQGTNRSTCHGVHSVLGSQATPPGRYHTRPLTNELRGGGGATPRSFFLDVVGGGGGGWSYGYRGTRLQGRRPPSNPPPSLYFCPAGGTWGVLAVVWGRGESSPLYARAFHRAPPSPKAACPGLVGTPVHPPLLGGRGSVTLTCVFLTLGVPIPQSGLHPAGGARVYRPLPWHTLEDPILF